MGEGEEGDICVIMANLRCTQKPVWHCKAIFLQLKYKLKQKSEWLHTDRMLREISH